MLCCFQAVEDDEFNDADGGWPFVQTTINQHSYAGAYVCIYVYMYVDTCMYEYIQTYAKQLR